MTKKQRAIMAVERLEAYYPQAECSLRYDDPLQLLIATRLAAQCTDARVNMVTPELFARYKTAGEFAAANVGAIEQIIKSCGLYKTKARDIAAMCKMITSDFGGRVPDRLELLLKLPGVGRKTANLMMGDIFGQPAVVTDTHCIRIANRLGLADSTDPYKVEMQLRALLPPDKSNDFCHRLVFFGREICTARKKNCSTCPLAECCKDCES